MDSKDITIARAGLEQFVKYGMRKTTMQDIADASGLSRQTLYNRVSNKDELLRLVAQYYLNDIIERCARSAAEAKTLDAAIDHLITHFVVEAWQTINAMPEARELEMASHSAITTVVDAASDAKKALIRSTLEPFAAAETSPAAASVDDIVDFFMASSVGIKSTATSETQLRALCATFKSSLMRLVAS